MDFVILGLLVGGVVVVAGVVFRDLGSRMKPWVARDKSGEITPESVKESWTRYCVAAGSLISTAGLMIVLGTVLAVVLNLSDSTGMKIVVVTSGIALAAFAVVALVVTPHYRRGGYDPKSSIVAPLTVTAAHLAVESLQPSIADPDDPFYLPEVMPTVGSPTNPAVVPSPENERQSGSPISIELVDEPDGSGTAIETVVEPIVHSATLPEVDHSSTLKEPGLAFEPWVAPEVKSVPIPASRAAYERHASSQQEPPPLPVNPMVDLDDELPAWNAPRVQESAPPVQSARPNAANHAQDEHQQLAAGFQSSLFANLDSPVEQPVEKPGAFKSRLLNELTGDIAEPEEAAEPVVDVLLEEFSLPQPPDAATRGTGTLR